VFGFDQFGIAQRSIPGVHPLGPTSPDFATERKVMSLILNRRTLAAWSLGAAVALAPLGAVLAQGAEPATGDKAAAITPISAYVTPARFRGAVLSPDGKKLAVLVPVGLKYNIAVLEIDTMKTRVVTNFTNYDVISLQWSGDWIVFSIGTLSNPTGPERGGGGGLFVVRSDGSGSKQLNGTVQEKARQIRVVGRIPNVTDEVIIQGNVRDAQAPDLYRLNLKSGRREMLTFDQPGLVQGWIVDPNGVPRVAVVIDKRDDKRLPQENEYRWLYRDTADQPWREIFVSPPGERDRPFPIAFAENGRDLIVRDRRGRDTAALYLFDVEKKQLSGVLAGHPRYDIGGGLLTDSNNRTVGLRVNDDTVQTVYFDEKLAALQAGLEKSFPGKAVFIQTTNSDRTLVTVYSDRSPSVYYIFDQKTRRLTELLRTNEELNETNLVAQTPFLYKTRDGLEIPGYYFLPANHKPGMKHPTVVHIHGGPEARADYWGWGRGFGVTEAQILASRGYAVIVPNFRITPEMGAKISAAGRGALGTTMSDDHEDAAKWGIAEGFVDPDRVCMSGASYGGYATLWALIRSNHIFKCGVAGLVVSDWEMIATSMAGDTAYSGTGERYVREELLRIKPGEGWEKAHAVSPARHAAKLKGPLFVYAGRDDIRTPLEQTFAMTKALKAVGKEPDVLMIKDKEGHGYVDPKNSIDLYEQMIAFLDKNIGPGKPRN
jgi:dipeptidyl aminopeptidase/acylaminoacyl peptidase